MIQYNNMEENNIYGADGQVKISFGRGTIHQAYEDRTIGGVNFGYDAENDFGVTFIEGKLYSSKVLNLTISGDTEKTVLVKYVNDEGYVAEKSFKTVDASLVEQMIQASQPEPEEPITYSEGDYIGIVAEPGNEKNFIVSVKYDELLGKIREDLINDIDISTLKDDVDTLKEEVAELYVDASTLHSDVSTLAEELSDSRLATSNAIADLEERKADKGDVCTIWKDVHDLLEDAHNNQ